MANGLLFRGAASLGIFYVGEAGAARITRAGSRWILRGYGRARGRKLGSDPLSSRYTGHFDLEIAKNKVGKQPASSWATESSRLSTSAKVPLFRRLFRGRTPPCGAESRQLQEIQ